MWLGLEFVHGDSGAWTAIKEMHRESEGRRRDKTVLHHIFSLDLRKRRHQGLTRPKCIIRARFIRNKCGSVFWLRPPVFDPPGVLVYTFRHTTLHPPQTPLS